MSDSISSEDDALLSYQPFRKKTCHSHGHSFWTASAGTESDHCSELETDNSYSPTPTEEDDVDHKPVADYGVFNPKEPYRCFDTANMPTLDNDRDNKNMDAYAAWVLGQEPDYNSEEYKQKQLEIIRREDEAKEKECIIINRPIPPATQPDKATAASRKELFEERENKKAHKMVRKWKKKGIIHTMPAHFRKNS
jgi:hypothetical protein